MDELVAVARKELAWETDYIREAKCQNMFRSDIVAGLELVIGSPVVCVCRDLLANDPGYLVPEVFPELSTKRVLTTELIQGLPLDQCVSLPQEIRNDVSMPHTHSLIFLSLSIFSVLSL